ncbi:MAG: O-antigen ligase family protein [Muribaculum sp.]|nr:O-antigen ligase family protein [Muribaculum sp.]
MKTQIEGFGLKDVINNTSLAGWILLARPVIYTLFSRRRDISEYAAVDFSAVVFIIFSVVAFFVGLRTITRSQSQIGKTILNRTPIIIFLAYSVLGIVSMLWSVNYKLTGFRAFECIAMTLLIVAVIQKLFETGSLKYVILWSLLYCTWDIIWALARTAQWATNIGTLLESSQMMATTFFFMALYFIPRRWYNYLILIMSVFSMSTVAYIGMALGAISSFWNRGKGRIVALIAAFFVLLGIVAIGPYKLLKNSVFFDKKHISIEETSGRDMLMSATLDCIDKYPWGLGFFVAEPYVLYSKGLHAIGAHNSLFSAGMGLGIPGVILIGLFFIAIGRVTFSRFIPDKYKSILIGCFCVAFIHCMGNPSVGTRVFGAWIPCMYIFVLICGMYIYGKYFEQDEVEIED